MKETQWRIILAWTITLFLAVMLAMLINAMIVQADSMMDEYMPRKVMFVLVMLSILAFKIFEEVLKSTVRLTMRERRKQKGNSEEPDPFMSWMRIIFSRED